MAILPSPSGVHEVEVTVPDTITEWKAGVLCLYSDTGLGLSLNCLSLSLPALLLGGHDAIICDPQRSLHTQVTVLNYLPKYIWVRTFPN